MQGEKGLTRREFEAVMRRATELALSESDTGELTETELYRIAREVGVADRHVSLALAQLRSGEVGGGRIDRLFGPEVVLVSRIVPGTPRELSERIDRFLVGSRLLQPVRRGSGILHYRPGADWLSQVTRFTSSSSRGYHVAAAKSVEVRLAEVEPDRVRVEFRVDPGTRTEAIAGALVGGGAGGVGAGVGVGIAAALIVPVAVAAAAGVAVGGALVGGIGWGIARSHRKKLQEVRAEVEGILDQLESGDPLEPPPPSWREWMRRQLDGARKVIGDFELDEPGRRGRRP